MDAIPVIGTQFQTFVPAVLAILCLTNYFDVWSKVVQSVGLEDLAFSEVFDPARVENGRKLCQIERNRRLREEALAISTEAKKYGGVRDSDDEDDETAPLTQLTETD